MRQLIVISAIGLILGGCAAFKTTYGTLPQQRTRAATFGVLASNHPNGRDTDTYRIGVHVDSAIVRGSGGA